MNPLPVFLPAFLSDRNGSDRMPSDIKKAGTLVFTWVSGLFRTALEEFLVVMGRIELPTYGL
jgi:hypothetical protein